MKKYDYYLKDKYNDPEYCIRINFKMLDLCKTTYDYINHGRACLMFRNRDSYHLAFESYEYAVRSNGKNFEARLGEYKAWYLYSLATKPTKWDPSIDDYYRNLIARTPSEYRKAVAEMYERDKANYLAEVSQNAKH